MYDGLVALGLEGGGGLSFPQKIDDDDCGEGVAC